MDGQCLLKPETFLELNEPFGFSHVRSIDDHILANNCPHLPLAEFIFDEGTLEGSTPLLLACHYGQFDSVKHIIERWGVDLNVAANYYPHPFRSPFFSIESNIQNATPLFVAAFNGHRKIVLYLLEKGARVNVETSCSTSPEFDGLSLLRGAVSECTWMSPNRNKPLEAKRAERGAIVRSLLEFGADVSTAFNSDGYPMWTEHLCGVNATAALINYGLDLTKCSPKLEQTLLHYWVDGLRRGITEEESLIIVKLLLNKGADLHVQDKWGFTPILRAANSFKYGTRSNITVLDYLLERDDVTREEKIEALELAGAAILANYAGDEELLSKAFAYWRRALHLRQLETEESGPIIKTPLVRLSGGKDEWTTLTQLEELIQQPFEYEIQSLLVRLRIFSGKSWTAVESLITPYFENVILDCVEYGEGRYDLVLDILLAMLDSIRLFDRHQKGLWELTVDVTYYLTCILSTLEREHDALWNHETIKTSLQLILATDQFHLDHRENKFDTDQYDMDILSYVVNMLIEFPEMQNYKTMQWLFQVVHRNKPEKFGTRLLHMACEDKENIIHHFDTILLLLNAGADANAVDEFGNAPLHVVASLPQELMDPAVRLLLESGAHLDRVNNAGKTAADIWIEWNETEEDQDEDDEARWQARPDWCRATRSLSCLSARAVRSHQVPYLDGDLPVTLNPFVEMH